MAPCIAMGEDGGRSFGPVQRVGLVDGVEYGYAFDAISRNRSTWMLVMTFANLPGGKLVDKYSSQPGSVDVIRSDGTRPIHVQPRHARHLASCRPGHRDGPIARGQLLRPTVLARARRPDPFLHHHLQAWCRARSGHRAARVQLGGSALNGPPWLRKGTRFTKPIPTLLTALRSRIDRIAITSPCVAAGLPALWPISQPSDLA